MTRRARRRAAGLRFRAEIEILADLERWRRTDSLRLCQTLYDLPAHQPARKETGQ
ncbi:hypothetical protein OG259_07835 [Streptomyces sp. NBC_00250]|uniref:hypothetical protein n=1 Tax=Streptomyces sp. NBC_00250 TaxID=2903641 RepID=UPI002E2AC206|nr:hypothetical protein [Streptomyces sp. NBC_00250]